MSFTLERSELIFYGITYTKSIINFGSQISINCGTGKVLAGFK